MLSEISMSLALIAKRIMQDDPFMEEKWEELKRQIHALGRDANELIKETARVNRNENRRQQRYQKKKAKESADASAPAHD